MENLAQKRFWRKCLDIILIILLSIVAISQTFESCIKWYQRQTTETGSLREIDQQVIFPKGILIGLKVKLVFLELNHFCHLVHGFSQVVKFVYFYDAKIVKFVYLCIRPTLLHTFTFFSPIDISE